MCENGVYGCPPSARDVVVVVQYGSVACYFYNFVSRLITFENPN